MTKRITCLPELSEGIANQYTFLTQPNKGFAVNTTHDLHLVVAFKVGVLVDANDVDPEKNTILALVSRSAEVPPHFQRLSIDVDPMVIAMSVPGVGQAEDSRTCVERYIDQCAMNFFVDSQRRFQEKKSD